jgi:hypothetical protein
MLIVVMGAGGTWGYFDGLLARGGEKAAADLSRRPQRSPLRRSNGSRRI